MLSPVPHPRDRQGEIALVTEWLCHSYWEWKERLNIKIDNFGVSN